MEVPVLYYGRRFRLSENRKNSYEVNSIEYTFKTSNILEIPYRCIKKRKHVLIFDVLIATGGSAWQLQD
jgi:adenine/guanine phosphoribosyltransferase-like PRPP-binding protein